MEVSRLPTRVVLLIDTATTWGKGLIEGIVDYGRPHQWTYFFEPRGKFERMLLPNGQRFDGVIARVTHEELANQLISAGIPAVNVSWYRFGEHVLPRCTCDEHATAKLAVDYFTGNGFRQFAYCGSSLRANFVDRFGAAFSTFLAERGYQCHRFEPAYERTSNQTWDAQLEELSAWLRLLPKPVAVLAFDDLQGRQVTEACRIAGISVPHDVAVLGGELDELSSRISQPELSSIDQAPQEVGYRAAEMLHLLLCGRPLASQTVLVPPRRILPRQSTDTLAVPDDMLSSAAKYIREHFHEDIHVGDLLRDVPLSRRSLEKGFRKHLGRSPWEEIRRVRVERAVQLLCDTDWSVARVANACGFDRPEVMTRAFRRELGTTPSHFRRAVRVGIVPG